MPYDSTSKNPIEALARKLYPDGGAGMRKKPRPVSYLKTEIDRQRADAAQRVIDKMEGKK
jgi:hypothetical protein